MTFHFSENWRHTQKFILFLNLSLKIAEEIVLDSGNEFSILQVSFDTIGHSLFLKTDPSLARSSRDYSLHFLLPLFPFVWPIFHFNPSTKYENSSEFGFESAFLFYILFSDNSNTQTVQFSSVTQSCPTLCDPMNQRMPGLLVHHELPESTQTYVVMSR